MKSSEILVVGCGKSPREDAVNLDVCELPGVDIVFDLETCHLGNRLPIEDNTFSKIIMSHVLEHIRNPLPMMQELWRVAKPGCDLMVRVPYGSSDNAWEDPTHVRPYFLDSFGYFSQAAYGGADYGYRGDWRSINRVLVMKPNRDLAPYVNDLDALLGIVMTMRNMVDEMVVMLKAVKPIRTPGTFTEGCPVEFMLPQQESESDKPAA